MIVLSVCARLGLSVASHPVAPHPPPMQSTVPVRARALAARHFTPVWGSAYLLQVARDRCRRLRSTLMLL
jgi:hypothetical protein